MDELVEKLKEIGLNEYQSKVYLALLKKFPATGYEISKLANIPQSRTYDTLKSLENMNVAISSNTKPITYTPIKPKELTKRYKRKLDSTINFLEKKLPSVKEENYTEPILSIHGKTKIIDKIIEIIKGAKKNIYIGVFGQDFNYIEQHLLDAYNRGLNIKIVKYDNFVCNFGSVFEHSTVPMYDKYSVGKYIFVCVDDNESLFGLTQSPKNEMLSVIWTKNPEITTILKALIIHDMYLIDIADNFPEQLKYFYGSNLKRLRDKVMY